MEHLTTSINGLIQLSVEYAPKILLAILVLIIGWWIAKRLAHVLSVYVQKMIPDNPELHGFFGSIVGVGMKILVLISVAGIIGIETTSFVGIIAAMGFAIGLALQGNLSNFAAGVMILLMKPFRVGDEVKIKGYWAFVKEIQIFHTVLKKFDQTTAIIPNSVIMNGTIENLSQTPTRSVKIKLNVPYNEDLDKIQKLLTDAAFSVPEIDQNKKPFFWIQGYETHFIKISIAFSTTQSGFWATEVKVNKAVIKALTDNDIRVAYPTGVAFGQFGGDTLAVSAN